MKGPPSSANRDDTDEISKPNPDSSAGRGFWIGVTTALAGVALAGAGFAMGSQFSDPSEATIRSEPEPVIITERLTMALLEDVVIARGDVIPTRLYEVPVPQEVTPVVSALHVAMGDIVRPGQAIVELAGEPVFVMAGVFPAWRDFEPGMSPGPDVRQLQEALRDLALFDGEVTSRYDRATQQGVADFWLASGYPTNTSRPVLKSTHILFIPNGQGVVHSIAVNVGDALSQGQLAIAADERALVLDLDPGLAHLVVPGLPIRLMDESRTLLLTSTIETIIGGSDDQEGVVEVTLSSALNEVPPSVIAEVVLDSSGSQVLSATPSAVFVDDQGRTYVVALNDGEQVRVNIVVGLVTDDGVEIRSADPPLSVDSELVLNPNLGS